MDRILQGRRVAEDQIDVRLPLDWIRQCNENHGASCTPRKLDSGFRMRVIDVRARCVVPASSSCRYVALSYVWGSPQQRKDEGRDQLLLIESNLDRLFTPGGLRDEHDDIPQTVRDALECCIMLDERYLWVDALCIRQDDEKDKKEQIANMSSVYGAAVFTIVACAGSSVNAGLPGVRPGTRKVRQHIETVDGLQLITALRPFLASTARSVWNSRGWTYEEKYLSRKLLFFTDYQIFFHCNNALWYEDAILETIGLDVRINLLGSENLRDRLGELKLLPSYTEWARYSTLVKGYTRRRLLQRKDSLNAFRGLITELKENLRSEFIWGMPEIIFDLSLTWIMNAHHHDPHLRNRNMPSWSWVSWMGTTDIGVEAAARNPRDVRSEVLWLHKDSHNRRVVKNSAIYGSKIHQDDSFCRIKPRWEPKQRFSNINVWHNESGVPENQLLRFWTQSVRLKVDRKPDVFVPYLHYWTTGDRFHFGQKAPLLERRSRIRYLHDQPLTPKGTDRLIIRGDKNRPMGAITLNRRWRASQPDELEFITLCRYVSEPEAFWGPGLMALLIEWQEDVAFRVQRVEAPFPEDAWKKMRPEWKFIMLG